jgi:hypothetical protein
MERGGWKAALALCAGLLAGCAQIPTAELTQYRQAFSQAQEASTEVLLDYDQAIKDSRAFLAKRSATQAPMPYPVVWAEASKEFQRGQPDDIDVRRMAFQVVQDYNLVLAQLAEGKSVEQAKAGAAGLLKSVDQLQRTLGNAGIPALSPLTSLVSTLAELFEKARLREEFVGAVQKGAPLVARMLETMARADIEAHYNLRAALLNRERLQVVAAMHRVRRAVAGVAAQRSFKAGELAALEARLNAGMAFARAEIPDYPVRLTAGPVAAPAFSVADKEQADAEMSQLAGLAARYEGNLQAAQAVKAMLGKYLGLLNGTIAAQANLVRALDRQPPASEQAAELLDVVFSLRRDLEEYRTARQRQ